MFNQYSFCGVPAGASINCLMIRRALSLSTCPVLGSANNWLTAGFMLLPNKKSYNSSPLTSKPNSSYSLFRMISETIWFQVFSRIILCCSSVKADKPFMLLMKSSFFIIFCWYSWMPIVSPPTSPTLFLERLIRLAPELRASPTINATRANPITILTSTPPRFLIFCNVAIYIKILCFYTRIYSIFEGTNI